MKIISKVECTDALRNLDEIIDQSDAILIDRGDLSKEIFLTRIPFTQKIIVHRARRKGKPVIVATNFLESMIQNRKPTRAEIHDIESSITDGASGLTLAAETAIGKYPIECINVMNQVIHHITSAVDVDAYADKEEKLVNYLEGQNYLLDFENHSPLIRPHGGKLINRFLVGSKDETRFPTLPRVALNQEQEMDAEQIGVGVYSPLEGFMSREELASVLDSMRLPSNIVWPLPIVLDVSEQVASSFREGDDVLLLDRHRQPLAILRLKEKYKFDKKEFAEKLYATLDENHPGVRTVLKMKEVFLGGPIDLLRRRESETRELEMTPSQSRRLFESLGWQRVVGFHTRNVIHRGHEFIQLEALRRTASDGVFVHPVVGKKKAGDFYPKPIVKCYTEMVRNFYSPNTVCLAAFPSYSRYAGPREALFTALCRQNYGCSHFIVGRDHTGVGKFYKPTASHDIFEEVEGIDITPVKFGEVFYSAKLKRHVEADETQAHLPEEKLNISGTEARQMFLRGEAPPEWFMRPEISRGVLDMVAAGEKVFVDEGNAPSGVTVWFTGLSGSGKTTIAQALKERLESAGKSVAVFDGDVVREKYHKNLDFSREGIRENNRLIAELVREARGKHDFILVPIISPYRDDRRVVRRTIGSPFLELYVNAPLEECIKRDVKGLYAKALAGQLQRMIGLSDENPYEPPLYPDLEVQTVGKSVEEVVDDIMRELK